MKPHEPESKSIHLDRLLAEFGELAEYLGFKNIHGRLWVLLFVNREALDALAIRKQLGISKALVSLTVNDLLRLKLIENDGKSSRGTLLYRSVDDITKPLREILAQRELKLLASLSDAHESLVQRMSQDPQSFNEIEESRLAKLKDYLEYLTEFSEQVARIDVTTH